MIEYPCDYIDKGGLAVTDGARGCSGTPTWQLVVRGALDPARVRAALADTVARYPILRTRVEPIDDRDPLRARRFRYVENPAFALDAIYRSVDARGAEVDALVHAEKNRPTDLFADPPLTLTLVRTGDDSCRLLFRQHHAIADGRAFIGLLADFARFLDRTRAATAIEPVPRRDELAPLGLSRARRFAWLVAGYFVVFAVVVRALLRPTVPLRQNRSNDYRGDDETVHLVVPDQSVETWNAARKRIGVSLNSLLMAAWFAANQRWHRAAGAPLGRTSATMVMETRPRDGGFVSFANHLATIEVALDLARVDQPVEMARAIQAQVDAQKRTQRPIKRLLAERALVAGMRLRDMRKIVFESKQPTYNLHFSNLIALEFPTMEGDGWRVDEVLITTPVTPRNGIAPTAIRYDGRVVFNFNFKASVVTRAEVERLRDEFVRVLDELVAAGEPRA